MQCYDTKDFNLLYFLLEHMKSLILLDLSLGFLYAEGWPCSGFIVVVIFVGYELML